MTEASMRHLAAAIVERAVTDWHKAVSQLESNPDYVYAWATKDEIERFFESKWFELLCEISPDFTKIHLQEARA
ncbi:MAG: hypothetical protein CVV48_05385 [Spirochaetae bacterium HGW-Spirochaetae-4]|jgi:hypothetical protein|uniref:Uncharacterized protein n=1 Tax=Sphaerochaeta associata TaxID=1129264 RepID=A0ABY4D717_9SPIR|nr:hypothetical protein [Sphaerochaeta associata]PKL10355.1 MAG: hypothetical protein CVV52_18830 [Spirochaetae bacterium HGW-Spirochaetae-8]PKL21898.1 MAG: hypothetical protein CVV48_05385 [Spirochaetae bacterium HGW-Spirochaetae-4]UOM50093.1 hypothetical protein MUG09_11055 [Sphaerochaeta associata]SMP64802.1 hypothetical protein SAMN06298221_11811 [Sphaerochaeta associata]